MNTAEKQDLGGKYESFVLLEHFQKFETISK